MRDRIKDFLDGLILYRFCEWVLGLRYYDFFFLGIKLREIQERLKLNQLNFIIINFQEFNFFDIFNVVDQSEY